jgi:hypothetical protein
MGMAGEVVPTARMEAAQMSLVVVRTRRHYAAHTRGTAHWPTVIVKATTEVAKDAKDAEDAEKSSNRRTEEQGREDSVSPTLPTPRRIVSLGTSSVTIRHTTIVLPGIM